MIIHRKKKDKIKSVEFIVFTIFSAMCLWGRSKHRDKIANGGKPNINVFYSWTTYHIYCLICIRFLRYAREHHRCRTLEDARAYVVRYLMARIAKGLSAWTLRQEASAIAKLFQCSVGDFGIELPKRQRGDVHKNFNICWANEVRHPELVAFCLATGLRRHELAKLMVDDVYRGSDGIPRILVRRGKGGKRRVVEALNNCVLMIAEEARNAGRKYVFTKIPPDAPTHAYRRLFAQALYTKCARCTEGLGRKELYICRRDMASIVFDRNAMHIVSNALGHNRLGVVTTYLRNAA